MTIRVMLVDDSAVVRGMIARALSEDGSIEVVGTAINGVMALQVGKQHQPDIIVLDIEMPEMDGITALPKLLEVCPNAKIIMASTLTLRNASISLSALELGASDYVAKPSAKGGEELQQFFRELKEKVTALAPAGTRTSAPKVAVVAKSVSAPVIVPPAPITYPSTPVKALAIASSTGGPQALITLFGGLKGKLNNIPIFITQHMPATFTTLLAEHLTKAGERSVKEGQEGEAVKPGQTYLAPGNFHMIAQRQGGGILIHTNQDPPENFCRPAADPMLRSLVDIYGSGLLLTVLTGMGSDGLEGAKKVVQAGGSVIAQDEASCVVWGMPKAVTENNLCKAVLPLPDIAAYLIRACQG